MRTLTATLKAAQRVSPQRPRVSLVVRDRQLRPVQVVGHDRMDGRPFELELPEGVRLQVPCDFDEGSLTRLLGVLGWSA